MPCGGIFPSGVTKYECLHCGGPNADHICIEWDGYVHGKCVKDFIAGDVGDMVLFHGHAVVVEIDGKTETLYEERQ